MWRQELLAGLLLFLLQARVTARSKLLLELVDSTGCVDIFQLARVKGMASAANVDFQFFLRAASDKAIAATATDRGLLIVWVDAVFHRMQ